MTTITNFIEGNFIANTPQKQIQRPFWVIDSIDLSINHRPITQAFINKCINDKKPLIHFDLGLSTLPKYSESQCEIVGENGLVYVKLDKEKPYYIVRSSIKDRRKSGFLPGIINSINKDVQKSKIREDKSKCSPNNYEFGLLIEGFQAWSLLNEDQSFLQKDLENFVNSLGSINAKIREIVVSTISPLLSEEANFHLERSSTCLTKVLQGRTDEWKCFSTVRRYNGFTNQEEYNLQLTENGRIKVVKKKKEKAQQRSKDQIQMVNSLGFTVQKDKSSKQQQKQLKQMIFPHLKMRQIQQDKCQKNKCKTACACKQQNLQDLIILDDEQQDDDDIDV